MQFDRDAVRELVCDNPAVKTLQRYAFALGKQIVVQVVDLPIDPRDAATK